MSKSKNYLTVDRTGVCNCKLKGNQSKEMAWKCRKCQSNSICRLHMIVLSVFTQKKLLLFSASNLNSGHVGLLFAKEEQKIGLAFDALAAHAGLVHCLTDTCCQAQNSSVFHGHGFATFKCQFLTDRTRNQGGCSSTGTVSDSKAKCNINAGSSPWCSKGFFWVECWCRLLVLQWHEDGGCTDTASVFSYMHQHLCTC